MASVVMAHVVMAHVVMASVVMAHGQDRGAIHLTASARSTALSTSRWYAAMDLTSATMYSCGHIVVAIYSYGPIGLWPMYLWPIRLWLIKLWPTW